MSTGGGDNDNDNDDDYKFMRHEMCNDTSCSV